MTITAVFPHCAAVIKQGLCPNPLEMFRRVWNGTRFLMSLIALKAGVTILQNVVCEYFSLCFQKYAKEFRSRNLLNGEFINNKRQESQDVSQVNLPLP